MNHAKTDLKIYLEKRGDLLEEIKKYSLSAIYLNELKDVDEDEYNKIRLKLENQKELNEYFLKEIKSLNKIAHDMNIKLIFLKGYCLGEDIYEPAEIRESKDMDVLVDYDDIDSALKIFNEMGYMYNFKRNLITTPIRPIYDINHYTHINQLIKRVKCNDKEILISVDLHINPLYHMPNYKKDDSRSVIYRAVYQKKDHYEAWVLELHDRLIHLIGHFERHIVDDIHVQLNKSVLRVAFPRLRIFHEIAVLIDKYSKQIDWDVLMERAKIMGQCEGVALSAALLKEIYPKRIPNDKLEKLINLINDQTVDEDEIEVRICKVIIKNINEWVFQDPYIFVDNLIQELRKGTLKLKCKYSEDNEFSEIEKFQLNNIFYRKNYRRISFQMLRKEEQEFMKCYEGFAKISWNDDNFNLKLDIFNKNDIDNKHNKLEENIETISFNLDTGKSKNYGPFTEKFVIHLPDWENRDSIKLIRNEWDYRDYIILDRSVFEIKSDENIFSLSLFIPWNIIEINPYIKRKLGFEMVVKFKENDKQNMFFLKCSYKNSSKVFPNAQESEEIILV